MSMDLIRVEKIHHLNLIIFMQLLNFLETNQIIDSRQAEYRSDHSPQTALLAVTEDAREALGSNMTTILVLFDFNKAFDMITHKKLLKKLHTLCKCFDHSLRWFFIHLHKKVQAVVNDGAWFSIGLVENIGRCFPR